MKPLTQTWKQQRAGKESYEKRRPLGERSGRNREASSNQSVQDKQNCDEAKRDDSSLPNQMRNTMGLSFLPVDWEMDSLNFESQIESPDTTHKIESKFIAANNTTHYQSLDRKKPQQCVRETTSTPVDVKNGATFVFCNNSASPVLQKADKYTIDEKFDDEHTNAPFKLCMKTGLTVTEESPSKFTQCIDSWGLPQCVVDRYRLSGINEMFEWQRECLLTGKALDGGNLVFCAPTSAGKTFVADLLVLKRLKSTKRKAIYILPFVSLAREKMLYLQELVMNAGICVNGYMGSQMPTGSFEMTDVAVCTIEKANSLVNRLMEEKKISCLGIVVIDELHMIGDRQRGYLLELMLSKILFLQGSMCCQDNDSSPSIQLVGMSATLPNLGMLAAWLNADLYSTEYRPVPLTEAVKIGRKIFDSSMREISEINSNDIVKGDEEHVIPLCLETIRAGHSLLIFCPTKQWCEKLAKNIADNLNQLLRSDGIQETDIVDGAALPNEKAEHRVRNGSLDPDAIAEVVEQLRRSPVGLDAGLAEIVSSGVSFHHAGLTFDERDIIEGAFRRGAIRVLVATSTLSAGVNLPARRVILRTPMFHGKLLNPLVYKQMTGRAGRKGVDTEGESILICKSSEKQKGLKLLKSHLDPVYSCLLGQEGDDQIPGMKRALLEIIATGVALTRADVERYANCTYLKTCLATRKGFNPEVAIQNTIQFLVENEFVRVERGRENDKVDEELFSPSQLGAATLASSLSPDEALVVFRELQKARRCFVLENELHIVYQVMPIYIQSQLPQLDWYHYFNLFGRLPPQYKRVGEIVGVEEGFLAKAIRGRIPTRTEEQRRRLAVHQRFYSALALLELVNEIPLRKVSSRYNINKGLLQSLQGSASTFAGMVTKFCEKLGWRSLEMLIGQFQNRLSFGITRELCDLVRISLLNGARARLLYNSGYHTVNAVALASSSEIAKLLEHFAPFETCKNLQGESARELESKKRVRSFWVTGKDGMTEAEAALQIVDEAKEIVRKDLVSMGVEITKIGFLSDDRETSMKSKEIKPEKMRSKSKENLLPKEEIENKPKTDLKRRLDIVPESNYVIKDRPLSLEGIPNEQGILEETDYSGQRPMLVNDKILKHEVKTNIASCKMISSNHESMPRNNSTSDIFKKLQVNADCRGIKIGELVENCMKEETHLRDSNDTKMCGQQLINVNQELLCETDKYAHIDNGHKAPGSRQDSASFINAFQPSNLLQNPDFCSISEPIDNQSNKVVNRTSYSNDRPKLKRCANYSNTAEMPEGVIKMNQDLSDGVTEALCFNGSFDSSHENSVEEINGSLILIDNKEEVSNCDKDHSKDITPELFSETLWGDIEVESTEKLCLGRFSYEIAANDVAGRVLNTSNIVKVCDSEAASDGVKGRYESIIVSAACVEKTDPKTTESFMCKQNVETATSLELALDSVHENMHNSSTDMFDDSFEDCSALNFDNRSGDSFHLKLSESTAEFESPDPLYADLHRCEGQHLGGPAAGKHESGRREMLVGDNKIAQGNEANDESSYSKSEEDNYRNQESNQGDQCHCSKSDEKPELQEIDWDFILSSSDSFANALCNIGVNEGSQNTRVTNSECNLDRSSCGQAFRVIDMTDAFKSCNKENSDEEIVKELEPFKEKERYQMDLNRNYEWKGKRKTDRQHEGECAGVMKRRSSERIAEKMFQVGQTDEFTIVDIEMNLDIFFRFTELWRKKDTFSFSVARISTIDIDAPPQGSYPAMDVSGVAVCLGGSTAFYIDFLRYKTNDLGTTKKRDEMIKSTIDMLATQLSSSSKIVFDAKEHYKVLSQSLGIELKGRLHDPKVAAWLLDPSSKEMTLQELAVRHLPPKYRDLVNKIGSSYDTGSIALMRHSMASPRLRSSIEAVLAHKLMSVLELRLTSDGLWQCFTEVEMPLMIILARMELNGFGFSAEQCEVLKQTLLRKANSIETKARNLAGRPFSINSPEDVAQVLYIEIGLPPSGDPNASITPKRGKLARRTRHLSTAKGILEKLRVLHPLPALILEWRKVNNALTTVVYPMQRAKVYCESLGMFRIHPRCQFHTVTGRVVITEPCLQHIPKDFDFEIQNNVDSNSVDVQRVSGKHKPSEIARSEGISRRQRRATVTQNSNELCNSNVSSPICMRSAFVPQDGSLLIAADYSQLELRIITHLSRDKRLISILNNDGDVFRMIAAETNQCSITQVTALQRQTAKHICYGMIYGIGRAALAEKLKVSEEEANLFMEKFKNRFVGIKEFTRRTIEFARWKGYVVTMGGRKRYFSAINSKVAQARSQAERQAVNTRVQGSAADLVKTAMINIEGRIAAEFCSKSKGGSFQSSWKSCPKRSQSLHTPKLVLQLHDELIYECCARDCKKFVTLLQGEMEQALKLEIPLPVKIRSGTSWGEMTEWQMKIV